MADYPTEEELEKIRHWPIGKYRELAEYVCRLWKYEDTATLKKEPSGSYTLRLATVGWSGNEDVVRALHSNMFYMACWYLSKRGGLHIFRIPANMAEVEPSEAGKDGCIEKA